MTSLLVTASLGLAGEARGNSIVSRPAQTFLLDVFVTVMEMIMIETSHVNVLKIILADTKKPLASDQSGPKVQPNTRQLLASVLANRLPQL